MEYQCKYALLDALEKTIYPTVKNRLPKVLERQFGADWFHVFAEPVMRKYEYYDSMVFPAYNPLENCDLTALWFLLFPYDSETGERMSQAGAAPYFQRDLGLTDGEMELLEIMRTLRNAITHNHLRMICIAPEHRDSFDAIEHQRSDKTVREIVYRGIPAHGQEIIHMDALNMMSRILTHLEPSFLSVIETYRKRILEELKENNTVSGEETVPDSVSEYRIRQYIGTIEEYRKNYNRYDAIPWAKEPVGAPLSMPVPWLEADDDLEGLPWPVELNEWIREKEVRDSVEKARKEADENMSFPQAAVLMARDFYKMFRGDEE